MKHIIVAILCAHLCISDTIYAGRKKTAQSQTSKKETEKKKKEKGEIASQQKFDFARLEQTSKDLVMLVIQQAWNNVDNTKGFETDLTTWDNWQNFPLARDETTRDEASRYGYHGAKTPIYFYTLKKGAPSIGTIGNILVAPRPAKYFGYFLRSTMLFLHNPRGGVYSVSLDGSQTIVAATLSVLGEVAIIWKDMTDHMTYLSFISLKDIRPDICIDLKKNATKLYDKVASTDATIKGILFMLDGSYLGVCHANAQETKGSHQKRQNDESNHHIDYVPRTLAKLTIGQKAKRLGIACAASKQLLQEKKKKKK